LPRAKALEKIHPMIAKPDSEWAVVFEGEEFSRGSYREDSALGVTAMICNIINSSAMRSSVSLTPLLIILLDLRPFWRHCHAVRDATSDRFSF
jgi:hypothetical protein